MSDGQGKREEKKRKEKKRGEKEGEVLSEWTSVSCAWRGFCVCEIRVESGVREMSFLFVDF